MIVIDSSVWVDYFNGQATPETDLLDRMLGAEPVAIGDLILAEVLQGFRSDADYKTARQMLTSLTVHDMLGAARAVRVAEHYRALKRKGVTVRKTANTIIATFCIEERLPLLFSDRDFEPFVRYRGLKSAAAEH